MPDFSPYPPITVEARRARFAATLREARVLPVTPDGKRFYVIAHYSGAVTVHTAGTSRKLN